MQFREVIGQSLVKERLIRVVNQGKVSHAQLFSGKEGCGTLSIALSYAQYILCTNRQFDDSCGECASCKKVSQNIHPDFHYVYPIIKGKLSNPLCESFIEEWRSMLGETSYFTLQEWYRRIHSEKGQGMIYAGESYEIVRKMNLKPYESNYKIMLIWMPELMNETASTKLLKLIEEPPKNTFFLLVSENKERIITTIRSRSQLINIPPLLITDLSTHLQSELGLDQSQADLLARQSDGSIVRAMQLLNSSNDQVLFFNQFILLMRCAYQRKVIDLKTWSDQMASLGREEQKSFFVYAQQMIRENFILNFKQPAKLNYMNEEESNFSQRFSPYINEGNVWGIMNELGTAQMHIEQNVNGKMVFFDICLKMIMLLKK